MAFVRCKNRNERQIKVRASRSLLLISDRIADGNADKYKALIQ